jgi:hypothetical protein
MLLAARITKLKGKKLFTGCSQNCLRAQVPTSWTIARGKAAGDKGTAALQDAVALFKRLDSAKLGPEYGA